MGNRPHSRIQNLFDLRYYLARLIGKVEREQISVDKAKALASLSRVLLDTLKAEQDLAFEERLSHLEEKLFHETKG